MSSAMGHLFFSLPVFPIRLCPSETNAARESMTIGKGFWHGESGLVSAIFHGFIYHVLLESGRCLTKGISPHIV